MRSLSRPQDQRYERTRRARPEPLYKPQQLAESDQTALETAATNFPHLAKLVAAAIALRSYRNAVARAFTLLILQRTAITKRLHPAVAAVKTLSFIQKYFHSPIIASICSTAASTESRVITVEQPGGATGWKHASAGANVSMPRLLRHLCRKKRRRRRPGECDEEDRVSLGNTNTRTPRGVLPHLSDGGFNRVGS